MEVLVAMAVSGLLVAALSAAVSAVLSAWTATAETARSSGEGAAAMDRLAAAARSARGAEVLDGALVLTLPGGDLWTLRVADGSLVEVGPDGERAIARVDAATFRVEGGSVAATLVLGDGTTVSGEVRRRNP